MTIAATDGAQDTRNLIGELEAPETDATHETDVKTDETKVDDVATKVAEQIETAKEEGASKEELNELRGMLRTLRNDNISLKARLSAAERVQKGEFGKDGKDVEPSELEVYQGKLDEARSRDFSQILAVMEVNPRYEDLVQVCSASNVSDIFETVAEYRANTNGTDLSVELLKVQAEVWSLPNPYKYMYDMIKKYHPAYTKAESSDDKKPLTAEEILKAKEKTPVKAPGSIADLGSEGGGNSATGWTAARIDSLPESELHTVPRDIYNKWLSGELK